jgi:hypothetical protein
MLWYQGQRHLKGARISPTPPKILSRCRGLLFTPTFLPAKGHDPPLHGPQIQRRRPPVALHDLFTPGGPDVQDRVGHGETVRVALEVELIPWRILNCRRSGQRCDRRWWFPFLHRESPRSLRGESTEERARSGTCSQGELRWRISHGSAGGSEIFMKRPPVLAEPRRWGHKPRGRIRSCSLQCGR